MILEAASVAGLGYLIYRLAAGSSTPIEKTRRLSARYAPGTETPAILTDEWAGFHGARPELRGAPRNTILNVKGLSDRSPEFRAMLLDLAEDANIPVDSLAVVMSSESGLNPAAVYKKDGRPFAVGLFQLTTQANLPGFLKPADLVPVLDWSAEEQLERIGRPYFLRFKPSKPPSPGQMYMLNFLPEHAGKPDDFVMGVKGQVHPEGHPKAGELTYAGKIYEMNKGFDPGGQTGVITPGAVRRAANAKARAAKGKRITVDGKVIEPSKGEASPAPVPPAAPGVAPAAPPGPRQDGVYLPTDKAGGILLDAVRRGNFASLAWRPVQVEPGLVIEVFADALRAAVQIKDSTGKIETKVLRLPVSYREQIEIAKRLGCVSLTAKWWDRCYEDAQTKLVPAPMQPDGTLAQTISHSENIDAQGGALDAYTRDQGKGWILDPRLSESGAVNYGWWDPRSGKPLQSIGARHDSSHYDYSQVCILAKREARLNGQIVDLLDILANQGIEKRFLDAYR